MREHRERVRNLHNSGVQLQLDRARRRRCNGQAEAQLSASVVLGLF